MNRDSYSSFKTKTMDNRNSNKRMNMRDMVGAQINSKLGFDNHRMNIARTVMERQHFNIDSRDNMDDTDIDDRNMRSNNIRKGEITGEIFNRNAFDLGMPLRSQYTMKKPIFDENKYLDFNLFESENEDESMKRINSFDPDNGGFSDVRTAMTKISNQVDPKSICSCGVEDLTIYMCNTLTNNMGSSFVVNGFGLYNSFACMYLPSSGNTEVELKTYFNYPKREVLHAGLTNMTTLLENNSKILDLKTFIIFSSHINYNDRYYDYIKDFCIMKRANTEQPVKESELINKMINRVMGKTMRRTIIPEALPNTDLLLLNVATITPIWNTSFDGIKRMSFNEGPPIDYMYSIGKTFGYYEDQENQLLEMRCVGDVITMGMILPKISSMSGIELDEKSLKFNIQHLKGTVLDEVLIPTFKQQYKLRFTNLLKMTDLRSVFIATNMDELFSDEIILNDVVQNIEIDIGPKSTGKKQEINRGFRTTRKFIADRPFYFYFRLIPTDTIVILGRYTGS